MEGERRESCCQCRSKRKSVLMKEECEENGGRQVDLWRRLLTLTKSHSSRVRDHGATQLASRVGDFLRSARGQEISGLATAAVILRQILVACITTDDWDTRTAAGKALQLIMVGYYDSKDRFGNLLDALEKSQYKLLTLKQVDFIDIFAKAQPLVRQSANAFGRAKANESEEDFAREREQLLHNLRQISTRANPVNQLLVEDEAEEEEELHANAMVSSESALAVNASDLKNVAENKADDSNRVQVESLLPGSNSTKRAQKRAVKTKESGGDSSGGLSARQRVQQKNRERTQEALEDDLLALMDESVFADAKSVDDLLATVWIVLTQHVLSERWGARQGAASAMSSSVRSWTKLFPSADARIFEDSAVRCMIVLGMDRFGDFASDKMVAPVRESCAQIIALCAQHKSLSGNLFTILELMLTSGQGTKKSKSAQRDLCALTMWACRYSALLVYKYQLIAECRGVFEAQKSVIRRIVVAAAKILIVEGETKGRSALASESAVYNDEIRRVASDVILTAMDPAGQMHGVDNSERIHFVMDIVNTQVADFSNRLVVLLGKLNDATSVSAASATKIAVLIGLNCSSSLPLRDVLFALMPKLQHPLELVRLATLECVLLGFQNLDADKLAAGQWRVWMQSALQALIFESRGANAVRAAVQGGKADQNSHVMSLKLLSAAKKLWERLTKMVHENSKAGSGTIAAKEWLHIISICFQHAKDSDQQDVASFALQCLLKTLPQGDEASRCVKALRRCARENQKSTFLLLEAVAASIMDVTELSVPDLISPSNCLPADHDWGHLSLPSIVESRAVLISSCIFLCQAFVEAGLKKPTQSAPAHKETIKLFFERSKSKLEQVLNGELLRAARAVAQDCVPAWLSQLPPPKSRREAQEWNESTTGARQHVVECCSRLETVLKVTAAQQSAMQAACQVFGFGARGIGGAQVGPIVKPLIKPLLATDGTPHQSSACLEVAARASVRLLIKLEKEGAAKAKALNKLGAKLVSGERSSLVAFRELASLADSENAIWRLVPSLKENLDEAFAQGRAPRVEKSQTSRLIQILTALLADESFFKTGLSATGSSFPDYLGAALRWLTTLDVSPAEETSSQGETDLDLVIGMFVACAECPCFEVSSWESIHEILLPFLVDADNHEGQTFLAAPRVLVLRFLDTLLKKHTDLCLPYATGMVQPMLAAMQNPRSVDIRLAAAPCFSSLVELTTVEEGLAKVECSKTLLEAHHRGQRFMQGLFNGALADTDSESNDRYGIKAVVAKRGIKLRPYQLQGVQWLAFLAEQGLSGALCDDLGLGKTLMSLTQLVACPTDRRASIVVSPSSLTGHWVQEMKQWYSDALLPVEYVGSPAKRQGLMVQTIQSLGAHQKHVVFVLSYSVLRGDIDLLQRLSFRYCILDEAHTIRNPFSGVAEAAKVIGGRSVHRMALTGTPVHNDVTDLWSVFDFLMPGYLGEIDTFQDEVAKPVRASREDFKASLQNRAQRSAKYSSTGPSSGSVAREVEEEGVDQHQESKQRGGKAVSKTQHAKQLAQTKALDALESLHRRVLPFILRRTKGEVLKDLPPKVIQDIELDLTAQQESLYAQILQDVQTSVASAAAEIHGSAARSGGALADLSRLLMACTHPLACLRSELKRVTDRFEKRQIEARISSIKDLGSRASAKFSALESLISDHVVLKNAGTFDPRLSQISSASSLSCDSDVLTSVELENRPHKAIIFAQWKGTIDLVEEQVMQRTFKGRLGYLRLDGGVPPHERQQVVNQFNSDPSMVILLTTTKVGGQGLNLTAADMVVFLESSWNPQDDLQAMDRAHRIGQKRVLQVYRLITRGTLEEQVMNLQMFKLHIANKVVGAANSNVASMKTDRILDVLAIPSDKHAGNKRQKLEDGTNLANGLGKKSLNKLLKNWDDMWNQEEYDDFDNTKFFHSLVEKKK